MRRFRPIHALGQLYGQVASFHQGFWLWIRSHIDWQLMLLQARADAPPRGQDTGMLQHVPDARGAHCVWSATTRLHFMVPGHGVVSSQATAAAPGHAPCDATEMP